MILEAAHFDRAIEGAVLVVTGEGRIDSQTKYGKAPAGVAARAKAAGIPCLAIAGGVGPGAEALHEVGVTAYFSICDGPMTLDDAFENAAELAERAGEQLGRVYAAGLRGLGAGMGEKRIKTKKRRGEKHTGQTKV